jgi:peptidoglycan/LPS O-acetylase OafA/YrhL
VTRVPHQVDTFFFLSGFLATWQMLEKVVGANPWKFVKGVLIHRYLRLTPLYFMVLMVYIYLFPVIGNGDHFGTGADMHRRLQASEGPGTPVEDFCQKYWWTNILYISNFYPNQLGAQANGPNGEAELGCMVQTWYISCDMQLFLVTLVAVMLYRVSVVHAVAFTSSVILGCMIYIGYGSHHWLYTVCDQQVNGAP